MLIYYKIKSIYQSWWSQRPYLKVRKMRMERKMMRKMIKTRKPTSPSKPIHSWPKKWEKEMKTFKSILAIVSLMSWSMERNGLKIMRMQKTLRKFYRKIYPSTMITTLINRSDHHLKDFSKILASLRILIFCLQESIRDYDMHQK